MITKDEAAQILRAASAARDLPYGFGPGENRDDLYVAGYRVATDAAKELSEEIAEGDRAAEDEPPGYRDLAWGTMIYACSGTTARTALPEPVIQAGISAGHITEADAPKYREATEAKPACGWEHRVWLGLGCEGPPALREDELHRNWVPVPFVCGTCPGCGTGSLQHNRWNEDEAFAPRPFPEHAPRFVLPPEEDWERLAARGYGGADYLDPTCRTISR